MRVTPADPATLPRARSTVGSSSSILLTLSLSFQAKYAGASNERPRVKNTTDDAIMGLTSLEIITMNNIMPITNPVDPRVRVKNLAVFLSTVVPAGES